MRIFYVEYETAGKYYLDMFKAVTSSAILKLLKKKHPRGTIKIIKITMATSS